MNVCFATQVFSQRVATTMKLLFRPMYKNDKLINSEGTVELLLFMDKTFDSLNASKLVSDPGKPLTGAVNNESESIHINHWNKAIKLFESMKFIDKNTKIPVKRQPPCITNWIFTLKSFKYLWFKLKKNNILSSFY